MDELKKLLDEAKNEYYYSGYQLYGETPKTITNLFGGTLSFCGNTSKVTEHTLFDIGSLTKVIFTTTLFALLSQRKEINLNDNIIKYLPEFRATQIENLTIRNLLSHRTGLITYYPIYRYIK